MKLNRFSSFKEAKLNEDHQDLNELARKMVGDGKEPNKFFVTLGYGHVYDKSIEDSYQIEGYLQSNPETVMMTESLEKALKEAMSYELDFEEQEDMLTQVTVEDRLVGTVYERSVHKNEDGELEEDIVDDTKMLRESLKSGVVENRQLTKNLLQKGEIDEDLYKKIEDADPTPQKKYMFWMAKQMLTNDTLTVDMLRNTVEEFDLFVRRGRIREKKDINAYKTFDELKKVVDEINERGAKSNKELERDFEIIEDTEEMYIVVPHSHDASRKLGLSEFAYRKRDQSGDCDSAWCTTFKTDSHFLDYYYNQNITFYYVKIRSEKKKEELKKAFGKNWEDKSMVAFVVHPDGDIEAYDAMDHRMSEQEVKKMRRVMGGTWAE